MRRVNGVFSQGHGGNVSVSMTQILVFVKDSNAGQKPNDQRIY